MTIPSQKDLINVIKSIEESNKDNVVTYQNIADTVRMVTTIICYITDFKKDDLDKAYEKMSKINSCVDLIVGATKKVDEIVKSCNNLKSGDINKVTGFLNDLEEISSKAVTAVPNSLSKVSTASILLGEVKVVLLNRLVKSVKGFYVKLGGLVLTQTPSLFGLYFAARVLSIIEKMPDSKIIKSRTRAMKHMGKLIDGLQGVYEKISELNEISLSIKDLALGIAKIMLVGTMSMVSMRFLQDISIKQIIVSYIKLIILKPYINAVFDFVGTIGEKLAKDISVLDMVLGIVKMRLLNIFIIGLRTIISSMMNALSKITIIQLIFIKSKLRATAMLFDVFIGIVNQINTINPSGIMRMLKIAANLFIVSKVLGIVIDAMISLPKIKKWPKIHERMGYYYKLLNFFVGFLKFILANSKDINASRGVLFDLFADVKLFSKIIKRLKKTKDIKETKYAGTQKTINNLFDTIDEIKVRLGKSDDAKKTILRTLAVLGLFTLLTFAFVLASAITSGAVMSMMAFTASVFVLRIASVTMIKTISVIQNTLKKYEVVPGEIVNMVKQMGAAITAVTGIALAFNISNILTTGSIRGLFEYTIKLVILTFASKSLIYAIRTIQNSLAKGKITAGETVDIVKQMGAAIIAVTTIMGTIMAAQLITGKAVRPILSMMMQIPLVTIVSRLLVWCTKRLVNMSKDVKIADVTAALKNVETIIGAITAIVKSIDLSITIVGKNILAALMLYITIVPVAILVIKEIGLFARILSKLKLNVIAVMSKRMLPILTIIGSIALVMLAITMTIPLVLPALLGIIPLTLFLVLMIPMMLAMSLLTKIIGLISSPLKIIWTLFKVNIILSLLIITALVVCALGLVAKLASKFILPTTLFLLAMVLLFGVLALFGLAISFITPYLIIAAGAIVGVTACMFIITLSIFLMTLMLIAMQNIKLDTKKIKENVAVVIETVWDIVSMVFNSPNNANEPHEKRSFWDSLLGVTGMVLGALTACVVLVLTAVSVFSILLIAGMLRLLQNLDLNPYIIKENVNIVLATANQIIDSIFDPKDKSNNKSSQGILSTLISWVDPKLGKIFDAALSVAYLALMLVAIIMVLGIASLLRLLQNLDLKPEVIKDNVDTVLSTANSIIDQVFAPVNDKSTASKGFLGGLISFFSPGLAKIVDAIMAVAFLGLIFASVAIIKGIAHSLQEFSEPLFEKDAVIKNVNDVFDTCAEVVKMIFEKGDTLLPEPKNRGIFGSIIGFFSPDLADILDALTMIAKLAVVQTAISAVAGIGKALKQINDIDTDLSSAKDKVDKIMGIAENVCERIFSRESKIKFPVPPKERKSVFGALITWAFGGGKSDEDRALEAAMKKVEALGIIEAAVGALGNILEAAKRIVDMKVEDLTDATTKVAEVMAMSEKLAESIFNSNIKFNLPEPSNDEVQAALIELGYDHWYRSANAGEKAAAKAQAKMKLAMQRVETLGLIASALGSIGSMIEGINNIKKFEIPEIDTVKPQVQKIMQLASDISFMIFNQDGIGQSGGNALGIKQQITEIKARVDFAKAGADGATSIMASYVKLIEAAKMSDTEIATAKSRTTTTLSAIGEILAQANSIKVNNKGEDIRNNCDLLDRVSKTIRTFAKVDAKDVKNSRDITDNYIKFLRKVDSMDLKKLQHTDYLMRSWASISKDLKGDFNGLAKTINEQIMPMIDALNKTLGDATRCQKEIITELTKPIDLNVPNSSGVGSVPIDSSSTGSFGGTDTDMNAPVEPTGRADGGSTQSNGSTSPTSLVRNNQKSTQTTQQTSLPNWPNSKRFEPKSGKYYKILVTEWEPA